MADVKVADIMDAQPLTVSADDDVATVIKLLREDDADLHLPHYFELFGGVVFLEPMKHLEDKLRKAFATKVRDMMTSDVLTIAADASVHEAARLISRSGHNRLPVVDEDGRLAGVVTRVDCLAALSGEG
jgi:CBS domain-containing protein